MSAYQNKFVERTSSEIRTKFDKYFSKVTFSNFVKYFLEYESKNCILSPDIFTTCGIDPHWHPYITRCGYCAVPYTAIGMLESMEEDLHHIGQMAEDVNFKKVESNLSGGGSTSSLTRKYFAELDRDLVMRLYEFYQVDFEMFGYSPEEYLHWAKGNI